MKKLIISTLVVLCAIVRGQGVDLPNGRFQLVNTGTGKCAAINSDCSKDKCNDTFWAPVVQVECNCEDFTFWTINKNTIKSEKTGQCAATWNGASGIVSQCVCVDDKRHGWSFTPEKDGFTIRSQEYGGCLYMPGGSKAENEKFKIGNCNENQAEQFKFVENTCMEK